MTLGSKFDGFLSALEQLCQNEDTCRKACSKFLHLNVFRDCDIESLLNALADLLLSPKQTLVVAYYLHDALPKILAVALSNDSCGNSVSGNSAVDFLHEKRCVALGRLLTIHPDVITFAMKYFMDHPSPFFYLEEKESHYEPSAKKRKMKPSPVLLPVTPEEVALSCYSFLKVKTDHFRELWDWSYFLKRFLNHEEPSVRWLAGHCCALVLKMGNLEKDTLMNLKLSPDEIVNCYVKYSSEEIQKREKFTKICSTDVSSSVDRSLPHSENEAVMCIAGITLPLSSKVPSDLKSNLVLVGSTQTNLQAIALGIATGKTLCLQGPVGCGKTALVEHLAKMTGHLSPPHFLSVQLGDQTDSKMLLGTYQCTDIPGEFVWKPGVLTQAVVGGYWLLLEDIDSCTTDVAAILASLLETRSLSVPGYKDCVHAAPGFQLFLTQRLISSATGMHRLNAGVTSMLHRHWLMVQMEPLSQVELVEIVKTLYPSLSTVASRMIEVFLLFSAGSHHSSLVANEESCDRQNTEIRIQTAGARLPSTRDLIKWCNRASEAFDVKSPESGQKLLQDAIDIFCCNVSDSATRLNLAKSIASKLGIVHTMVEHFLNVYKPVIPPSTSTHVTIGRITLCRRQNDTACFNHTPKSNFSFTRPAAALLERIASCISHNEPILLVGETGVGKTSSIQYLAQQMGQTLSVINMNQQSDSADLLGGFKPVELKVVMAPLRDEFETLFRSFFAVDANAKFLSNLARCFSKKMWTTLLSVMKEITDKALKKFEDNQASSSKRVSKSSKLDTIAHKKKWLQLSVKLRKVDEQLKKSQNALAFTFVEGSLVKAVQEGQWVLLDEINLASAQTLECLSSLLEGSSGSLYLLERGDDHSIRRHPNFRIFAAMNPATDVGKKELPPGIRNRFTEFFVDELVDRQDLFLLCSSYLAPHALPAIKIDALVQFYLTICKEAVARLCDGTGHKPHYSLRTLCRALLVAASNPCGSVPRSLYEGFMLSFLTQLDRSSHPLVEEMVAKAVMGKSSSDPKSLVKQPIPSPVVSGKTFIQVQDYWISQGSLEPIVPDKYILTKTVKQNLRDLVRVVSLARLPVLLQGETSVGKTSLITYLAQLSGNRCLRINNHEHTDLQEYIGCYAADDQGKLVFREGVLVEAMRYGHWVILDELNLAPSDVLEALNRVLDDNRELFIPETQEVVKAHPNFMLFATQNPPGLYGGRKVLSRAFRNRFIELHFDEIPSLELETIMNQRCDLPPSYCKKMVAVMADLQVRRRGSAAFAGKQGFITLRDLFRWGERYRLAQNVVQQGKYYDWDQHIADEGYLILAGRVRKEEECKIIQESLLKHIKRTVNPDHLFTLNADTSPVTRSILESIMQETPPGFQHIVWTYNVRRLAVLLGKACDFKEPILLVGETGCGKTTLCQVLAASKNKDLITVNCHMHSESSDFLGGLRPVRERSEENKSKLFEWVDGPLIEAMQKGGIFLADEISLADDSVLERLNSLLEPERKLLLAEKGSSPSGEPFEIVARDGFIFVGTMNPGGDYGKKELSPALRNRFTEIWCEGCSERSDLIAVIEHNLRQELIFRNGQSKLTSVGSALVDFLEWFSKTDLGNRFSRSLRDVMTWVEFINVCTEPRGSLELGNAYIHGACLTFLDSLGTGLTSFASREAVLSLRVAALNFLRRQVIESDAEPYQLQSFLHSDSNDEEVSLSLDKFGIKPFYISRGCSSLTAGPDFLLSAPTTRINAMRVLRGLQLGKALLLEGSPGVGKTSLVAALARGAGHRLTRINLSDQTDISDLFGADLPVEGGVGGQFEWRDGPFLQALKAGHWILLDELNLASQSVLEGLNAVLDHRGDLFIPELGRTFHIQSDKTRLFACQNPLNQGGARKGLPQSFLNRFTQVYMDTLTSQDLEFICKELYPSLPFELIRSMVTFNQLVSSETAPGGRWGQRGAPWEMNLRDLSRWCEATLWGTSNGELNPGRFVQLIYVDRMRSLKDKEEMMSFYQQTFHMDYPFCSDIPQIYLTPDTLYLGDVALPRGNFGTMQVPKLVLRHQLPALQSLARCVSLGWLSILVGPSGCGKTSLVHTLAQLAGQELRTLVVNSAMDTTEILGGFEQADYKRHLDEQAVEVQHVMTRCVQHLILLKKEKESNYLLSLWEGFVNLGKKDSKDPESEKTMELEVKHFYSKIEALESILNTVSAAMFDTEDQQELQRLQENLIHLKEISSSDNSLNTGGKFEWVDSILIKSLMDGCWLLVDNVNLCSAAVLDRLNGLLEPQGVLTVSERGVDSHGELITIHPHPDFRLFLAMDPKYGEISRAMRNRGVEIFVTTCEGDLTTSLPQLDQAALLQDIGVSNQHDQQLLFNTHESMSKIIQGPDPPGLTELLHASYLFVQQTQRGMSLIPSLLSSFTKVYIQSRLCDSIEIKRRNLTVLEEVVRQGVAFNKSSVLDKLVPESTIKTSEVCLDSSFATVKQRSALLSAFADAEEHDLTTICEFLGITEVKVDLQMLLIHLVLMFYQTCSTADVSLGCSWLQRVVEGSGHGEMINQLSEVLHSTILKVQDLAKSDLMWDRRWLPDVLSAIIVQSEVDDQGLENRVALLLYISALSLSCEKSLNNKGSLKNRNVSILEYSHAVSKGALSDSSSSEPIFVDIGPCLEKTLHVLRDSLNSVGVLVSDDQWWSLRTAFHWIQRFLKQAASLFISSDKNSMAENLNLLAVHYRWFTKHAVPVVIHLANEAVVNVIPLCDAIKRINASVVSSNSALWHIAKKLRREVGQPPPIASDRQAVLISKALQLNNLMNVWCSEKNRSSLNAVTYFLVSCEGLQAKAALAVAFRDLVSSLSLDKVEERLAQAEELCSKADLLNNSSIKDVEQRNLQTLLWPFQEIVCLHAANPILVKLLKNQTHPAFMLEMSTLIQAMQKVSSIPAGLIGFFEAFQMERTDLNLFQGMAWLFQFSSQSLAVTNFQSWVPCNLEDENDIRDAEEYLAQHCPILSRLAANLLFNHIPSSKEHLCVSSLERHADYSKLFLSLRALFWQNSDYFSNPLYAYRVNEVQSVVAAANYFLTSLENCCSASSAQNLLDKTTNICEYLQIKFGSSLPIFAEFKSMLSEFVNVLDQLERSKSFENDTLMKVGLLWTLLGCLESQLFSAFPQIDPMSKNSIKMKYIMEEIQSIEVELLAAKMCGSVRGNGRNCTPSHPLLVILENKKNDLNIQLSLLRRQVAVRPDPPLYLALTKELHHFANSLGSVPLVGNLSKRLMSLTTSSSRSDVQIIVKEAQTWSHSLQSFRTMLEKRFCLWYPDIVLPVLASTAKLCRGVELMVGIGRKTYEYGFKGPLNITLSKLVCSLGNFPSLSAEQPSIIDLVSNLTDKNCASVIEQALHTLIRNESSDLREQSQMEAYWLLKSAVLELKNFICVSQTCSSNEWNALIKVLQSFLSLWQRQETERRVREEDNERLYKSSGAIRCQTVSEDTEAENEIAEMFPSMRENDFGDLEPSNNLDEAPHKTSDTASSSALSVILSDEDVNLISSLHISLVLSYTKTEWIGYYNSHPSTFSTDYLTPWLQRCAVAARLLSSCSPVLDDYVDKNLLPSWTLASYLAAPDSELMGQVYNMSPDDMKFDFYQTPCVNEVRQCKPVLDGLRKRVNELLDEWPEHPTLNQLITVIDRINAFSISSPISRFLTGLEILLNKMREWEENAHVGVSLSVQSTAVTNLIIQWRRLELMGWKGCLNAAALRMQVKASKWWFYVFSLVEAHLSFDSSKEEEIPTKDLLSTLQRFMEEAPLGEFETRINIIYAFHCHVVNLPTTKSQRELLFMLWNLYSFYSQFKDGVSSRIVDLKAPIEKKLKDFVKISRWNHIDYWAVKDTVFKTQRTLHKHVKEFEKVLREPARSVMLSSSIHGNTQLSTKFAQLKPQKYIFKDDVKIFIGDLTEHEISEETLPHVHRAGQLLTRSKKLTKEIILFSSCPTYIASLDKFAGDIAASAQQLSMLEVDRSIPKSKQISQAKNQLQVKRKALADLFRMLQRIGLSHRAGLTYEEDHLKYEFTQLPPLDMVVFLKSLNEATLSTTSPADNEMIASWDGCNSYLMRSWARFVQLISAVRHPHKDHGPQNLERLRGFPTHLLALVQSHHKEVFENTSALAQARLHLHKLKSLQDFLCNPLPCQSTLREWNHRLQSLLVSSSVTLRQFRLLLDACPGEGEGFGDNALIVSQDVASQKSNILGASKNDIFWQKAVEVVDQVLSLIEKCQKNVSITPCNFSNLTEEFITVDHFNKMSECYKHVATIANDLSNIQRLFAVESFHPYVCSLKWLQEHILDECSKFSEICQENHSSSVSADRNVPSFSEISLKVNDLMHKVLLSFQKVYKNYTSLNEPLVDETVVPETASEEISQKDEETEDDDLDLEEKHLSDGIIKSLQCDIQLLSILEIKNGVQDLLSDLLATVNGGSCDAEKCVRLALRSVPLVQQWLLLLQFVVQQQVAALRASSKLLSTLLAVFGNVTVKGFCMPEELLAGEEAGDGEGQSDSKQEGSMGLGDGEGEKDVSDRIESEDQLEDARPAGEEKKDDDKDCKEEDNGIEMSENFDGKQQDMNPKSDEDDEDKEEDENDGEKEMGDTEKDAECLDEQIWGSDSEDNNSGDDGEGDEEEGQSGEKVGDKEISARENETDKDGKTDDNDPENGEEKKQENKKPEINEMDEPDVDDDQINPYHGNQQPEVEPDPMELPEDLQLDEGDAKDNDEANEDNPFDIDEMKEQAPPEVQQQDTKEDTEETVDKDQLEGDASDDEDEDNNDDASNSKEEETHDEPASGEEYDENPDGSDETKSGKKQEDVEEEKELNKEEETIDQEERQPSKDDPTSEPTQKSEDINQGSMDQVASTPQESQEVSGEQAPEEADGEPGVDDKEAVGQAPSNQEQKGHHSDQTGKRPQRDQQKQQSDKEEKRQRPGRSDDQRSLGDMSEPLKKRLKTVDTKQTDDGEEAKSEDEALDSDNTADLYQHIKDVKEKSKAQTLDAATEEQAEQQPVAINNDDDQAPPPDDESMDIDNIETPLEDEVGEQKQREEAVGKNKKEKEKEKGKQGLQNEVEDCDKRIEIEGERVETLGASRGPDTTFHTRYEELVLPNIVSIADIQEECEAVRRDLQNQLSVWNQVQMGDEASKAWQSLTSLTNSLARDLSEQLRLVLEPTQATRMKGDFRTGRRINMRKVIPYIASQFRKDKIWMRRTKPSKREYQILLAIDDSSSMADNRSKELAFESLALVSQALTLLEVGELGILSFGEIIKVLHKLGEPFTQHSGARLLQQFSFEQRKTQIGVLVDYATALFTTSKVQTSAQHAQLLVVMSDGRGVFSEGQEKVYNCVRKARLAGIFMVFVIIDNPESKDSILDIRTPIFSNGKLLGISSYMDSFPFPFYLILRDISNLPAVLSDALRQWFELVSSAE